MLKNKKATYLLIPLNLLIWGFFIYRFYSAYTDAVLPDHEPRLQAVKLDTEKDSSTYTLQLNYKDPFLKGGEHVSRPPAEPSISPPPKPVAAAVKEPPAAPKQLPDIKYLGLIKNSSTGMATALVSLNGQSHLIKPNDTFDGICFKSFNNDSLVARWGKERIVARK